MKTTLLCLSLCLGLSYGQSLIYTGINPKKDILSTTEYYSVGYNDDPEYCYRPRTLILAKISGSSYIATDIISSTVIANVAYPAPSGQGATLIGHKHWIDNDDDVEFIETYSSGGISYFKIYDGSSLILSGSGSAYFVVYGTSVVLYTSQTNSTTGEVTIKYYLFRSNVQVSSTLSKNNSEKLALSQVNGALVIKSLDGIDVLNVRVFDLAGRSIEFQSNEISENELQIRIPMNRQLIAFNGKNGVISAVVK